jgi:hypothetical protein
MISVLILTTMPTKEVKSYTKDQLSKRLPAIKPKIVECLDLESEKKISKDMLNLLKELLTTDTAPESYTRDEIDEFIENEFTDKWNEGQAARDADKKARKEAATAKAKATRESKAKSAPTKKKEMTDEEKAEDAKRGKDTEPEPEPVKEVKEVKVKKTKK